MASVHMKFANEMRLDQVSIQVRFTRYVRPILLHSHLAMTFRSMRFESISFNRIVTDKLHRATIDIVVWDFYTPFTPKILGVLKVV